MISGRTHLPAVRTLRATILDGAASFCLDSAPARGQGSAQAFVVDRIDLVANFADALSRVTQSVLAETAQVDQLLERMRDTGEDEKAVQDSASGAVGAAPW